MQRRQEPGLGGGQGAGLFAVFWPCSSSGLRGADISAPPPAGTCSPRRGLAQEELQLEGSISPAGCFISKEPVDGCGGEGRPGSPGTAEALVQRQRMKNDRFAGSYEAPNL